MSLCEDKIICLLYKLLIWWHKYTARTLIDRLENPPTTGIGERLASSLSIELSCSNEKTKWMRQKKFTSPPSLEISLKSKFFYLFELPIEYIPTQLVC